MKAFACALFLTSGCVTSQWSAEGPDKLRLVGHIVGHIEKTTNDEFFRAIAPSVKEIVVTSGGGDAATALAIGEYIHAHDLGVTVDGFCASSCANSLFLAGRRKMVLPGGWVGFHGGGVLPPR